MAKSTMFKMEAMSYMPSKYPLPIPVAEFKTGNAKFVKNHIQHCINVILDTYSTEVIDLHQEYYSTTIKINGREVYQFRSILLGTIR